MKRILLVASLMLVVLNTAIRVDLIEIGNRELFLVESEEVNMEMVKATYQKIPENVREAYEKENGQIIIVGSEDSVLERVGRKSDIRTAEHKAYGGETVGLYDRFSDTIYIQWTENEAEFEHYLLHEMGHYVGSNGSLLDKLSLVNTNEMSDEWEEVYESEAKTVSGYAGVFKNEGFAESFAFYLTDKDDLKGYYPQTYEFVENCIKNM